MIRGGYSIFYSGSSYAQIATQMASQPPFATSASLTTSIDAPLTIQNGFATSPTTLTNTYAIDPNFRIAYAQTWNVAVQHTLPHGLVVETEYIGTKGTDLGIMEKPNRSTSSIANAQRSADQQRHRLQLSDAGRQLHYHAARCGSRGGSRAACPATPSTPSPRPSTTPPASTARAARWCSSWTIGRWSADFPPSISGTISPRFQLSSPVGVHGLLRNGGWKTKLLRSWT